MSQPRIMVINRQHWYTVGDGWRYPSVTSVIRQAWPADALTNWVGKVTAEEAIRNRAQYYAIAAESEEAAIEVLKGKRFQIRDSAANRGTALHEAVRDGRWEDPQDEDETTLAGLVAFRKWVDEFEVEIISQEVPVVSTKWWYGGTYDLECRIAGGRVIVDLKTGAVYDNHHVQVAAYVMAAGGDASGGLLSIRDGIASYEMVDVASSFAAFRGCLVIARYRGLTRQEEADQGPQADDGGDHD